MSLCLIFRELFLKVFSTEKQADFPNWHGSGNEDFRKMTVQERVGVCRMGDPLETARCDGNTRELQLFCPGFPLASVPKDTHQSGWGQLHVHCSLLSNAGNQEVFCSSSSLEFRPPVADNFICSPRWDTSHFKKTGGVQRGSYTIHPEFMSEAYSAPWHW